jgi:restriction system protein
MTDPSNDLLELHVSKEYTRSSIRYIAEIRHKGLNTVKVLKDTNADVLQYKVNTQFAKWQEQWAKGASLSLAQEQTKEAKERLAEIDNLLIHTLSIDDTIDWEILKTKREFEVPNPQATFKAEVAKANIPPTPAQKEIPPAPNFDNYRPTIKGVSKLFKSRAKEKLKEAEEHYNIAMAHWEKISADIKAYNEKVNKEYADTRRAIVKSIQDRLDKKEAEWEKQRDAFYKTQEEGNAKIDVLKEQYLRGDPPLVVQYCELVLNNSQYPESFPKTFELDYNKDNKLLIVEYSLPSPEQLPRLSEVKYIASKKELKEFYLSDIQFNKRYDNAIYCICLRTIHELFEADKANAIDMIAFNGWVEIVSKATGNKSNSCIISVQAKKSEFIEIQLANIDPKACFKNLKGIGSSKLVDITPIKPLILLNKNDKRFINSREVASTLDEGCNLAAMDWEDFEQLIREVFEKEFSVNGGEVKVTQASRDGGVDAIAFDPDPIRGGKIIIQAKRYTNTVGVSAVRDLYGTVLNEGATKGILVTTADYGTDSYDFAKNKPITLLNGSNLLFLLEKHGHKARIDIMEAKKLQMDNR